MNDGFRAADLSVSRHLAELRASGRVRLSCPNAPKRRSICHSARLHAISNRLASATMPMRRMRKPPPAKRARYHWLSALPG
jgi:hypothetical protein